MSKIEHYAENYDDQMQEFTKSDLGLYIQWQNLNNQQQMVQLDESIGYLQILEEGDRPLSDKKKNIPYILKTKRTQFQTSKNTVPNVTLPKQFIKSNNPFSTLPHKQEQDSLSSYSQDDNEKQILHTIVDDIRNNLSNKDYHQVIDKEMIGDLQRRLSQGSQLGGGWSMRDLNDIEKGSNKVQPQQSNQNLQRQASLNNILILEKQDSSGLLEQNMNQFISNLPEAVEEDDQDEDVIYKLVKDNFVYCSMTKEEIFRLVKQDINIEIKKEDPRHQESNKDGGKECVNDKIRVALRNTGKKIIKEIGKKLISGDFNLTTISFPIKCMIPISALQKALASTCLFPFYMNKATEAKDPVERIKFVICATLGQFFINLSFLKPLNPIIGETCQGSYPDGTQLYAEQISHHPPISYFYIVGPQGKYKYWGNYNYESNASINSLALKNRGSRHIKFTDTNQVISYNFAKEVYSGSFWGTMKVESMGRIDFKDETNGIEAYVKFDDVSRKPTDYFKGKIKKQGTDISKIYGSYMGFCDFDSKRYWDINYVQPFKVKIEQSVLGSDSQYRKDKLLLERGHINLAQKAKVELEEIQREDAKFRKNYIKAQKKSHK